MTYVLPIVAAITTAPARRAVERHRSARETENGKKTRIKGIHRDRSIERRRLGGSGESGHRQEVLLRG